MKQKILARIIGTCLTMAAFQAQAMSTTLTEYAFNVDGTVTDSFYDPMPSTPAFDTSTGLGTVTFTFSAGNHSVLAFFDHEINLLTTGLLPEFGAATGTLASGQSWQIDEPFYGNLGYFGNIYSNFKNNALNNSNGIPTGDDASMALGWNFTVAAGYTATVQFVVDALTPRSGFYLTQTDGTGTVDVNGAWDPTTFQKGTDSIYLSSSLNFSTCPTGGCNQTPEPRLAWLLLPALAGLLLTRRKVKRAT
jgi:hypothetical protein